MSALLSLLLNPKNLLIALLSVALGLTWFAYDMKKHSLLKCEGKLATAEEGVKDGQEKIAAANVIIDGLKANIAAIRKQLESWKKIAADAEEFSRRILAAAEGKKECEVYHAENAKLAVDITDYFNSSVRRKINRPAPAGDSSAGQVLPPAGAPGADPAGSGRKDDRNTSAPR